MNALNRKFNNCTLTLPDTSANDCAQSQSRGNYFEINKFSNCFSCHVLISMSLQCASACSRTTRPTVDSDVCRWCSNELSGSETSYDLRRTNHLTNKFLGKSILIFHINFRMRRELGRILWQFNGTDKMYPNSWRAHPHCFPSLLVIWIFFPQFLCGLLRSSNAPKRLGTEVTVPSTSRLKRHWRVCVCARERSGWTLNAETCK